MFNLFPGQGLGFTANRQLAFGLCAIVVLELAVAGGGVYWGESKKKQSTSKITLIDNAYSIKKDDKDLIELLVIIMGVING